MAFLWSTPGPSPCPACDAELGAEVDPAKVEACSVCGLKLRPIHTASFVRRAAAFGLDLALLALTAGPLAWLLSWAVGLDPLTDGRGIDALLQILADDLWRPVRRAMPLLIMATTYFALFSVLRGQSLGQRVLGIRIVDERGESPSMARAIGRVAAAWLSFIPAGLGALWMLFDFERRAVHDHLTATWVVRNSAPTLPAKTT